MIYVHVLDGIYKNMLFFPCVLSFLRNLTKLRKQNSKTKFEACYFRPSEFINLQITRFGEPNKIG